MTRYVASLSFNVTARAFVEQDVTGTTAKLQQNCLICQSPHTKTPKRCVSYTRLLCSRSSNLECIGRNVDPIPVVTFIVLASQEEPVSAWGEAIK